MYTVSVINNYIYPLTLDGGSTSAVDANGGKAEFKDWGSHYLSVPGMGGINFIDMGDKKLEDYTNPELPWTEATWGGLIRYRNLDAYFRYEGGGKVDVVVDQFGSVTLHFGTGGGMIINLDDLTVASA